MPAISGLDSVRPLILPHIEWSVMQLFLEGAGVCHPSERIVIAFDETRWHQSGFVRLPDNLPMLLLCA